MSCIRDNLIQAISIEFRNDRRHTLQPLRDDSLIVLPTPKVACETPSMVPHVIARQPLTNSKACNHSRSSSPSPGTLAKYPTCPINFFRIKFVSKKHFIRPFRYVRCEN